MRSERLLRDARGRCYAASHARSEARMSVLDHTQAQADLLEHIGYEERGSCFFCGDFLAGLIVYWSGALGELYLHPHCACKLGTHLISDSGVARQMVGVRTARGAAS